MGIADAWVERPRHNPTRVGFCDTFPWFPCSPGELVWGDLVRAVKTRQFGSLPSGYSFLAQPEMVGYLSDSEAFFLGVEDIGAISRFYERFGTGMERDCADGSA